MLCTFWKPFFFSKSVAIPLRVPLAQQRTTGEDLGISPSRLPNSWRGMLIVPGAFPLANSAADLTSISVAPFFLSSGSKAATRFEFHHLYANQRPNANNGQYVSRNPGKFIKLLLDCDLDGYVLCRFTRVTVAVLVSLAQIPHIDFYSVGFSGATWTSI